MNESHSKQAGERTREKRDEKLRIQVRGTNRKYYLVPPSPAANRPDYYVRFEVPRDVRAANDKLPKTVFRSTGTNILSAAKIRGRDIIEPVLEGRWEQAEKTKLAIECATLGEILERYNPPARDVKPPAAKRNRSSLDLIVSETIGREHVREERADRWATAKFLQQWIELRLERVKELDLVIQERAAVTINSTLAMARSVLSEKVMNLYQDLKLPDLTTFRAVPKLKVEADVSYQPLPQVCVDAVERDARLLAVGKSEIARAAGIKPDDQPKVWLVYLLMSRLGLRNSEALAARWSWIERQGSSAELVIERRPDFVPKNKRRRRQDIDAELLAQLDHHRGLPDAWIIDAPTPTERFNICHRLINRWLRPMLPPDREKGAYELRKHAASIIVSRPESEGGGITAAANFLGDTIATTEKHYAKFLRKVRGIRSSEISSGRVAA